jgi:hypothetical protein
MPHLSLKLKQTSSDCNSTHDLLGQECKTNLNNQTDVMICKSAYGNKQ